MPPRAEQQKTDVIETVATFVRDRLSKPKVAAAERFVRMYYRHVAPDDMLQENIDDLYGAALSLWQFAAERRPGTPKIRAYNPQYDEHGWHASHTVVEIINDDMPFLVDSVTSALNELGLTVHLVIHPVLSVIRDADGMLQSIHAPGEKVPDAITESQMHVEVDEQTSAEALGQIEARLHTVLADVRAAVEDWSRIRARAGDINELLRNSPPPVPAQEVAEVIAFLDWLDDDHFTYLGYREYRFYDSESKTSLNIVPGSGLGLLRDDDRLVFEGMRRRFDALPPEVQDFVRQPVLLMVTKANAKSTVHRPVHLDTIIVKSFDKNGTVTGERMIVGLFTSAAYNETVRAIPFLRQKVTRTMARAGFNPRGHNAKALTHILNSYPRDELYQISDDELYDIAIGILHLQERQRTALFVRQDPFERFVSCLVFLPRDRYNTAMRQRIQEILEDAFSGETTAFYTQLTEGMLARVHFLIQTTPGQIPEYDAHEVEQRLVDAGRTWSDRLQQALVEIKGEERGLALFRRYGEAFPTSYREYVIPQAAIFDIERIEEVLITGTIGINLYRPIEASMHQMRFKLYHPATPVPLSDVLPMLEHMGLRVMAEMPFEVAPEDHDHLVWIHDFAVETPDRTPVDLDRIKQPFQAAFARVWYGDMEDDGFNRLVLGARLDWREVVVLRAYGKYLRQARAAFSQRYLEDVLAGHSGIARLIIDLFVAIFDPARGEPGTAEELGRARDAVINGLREDLDRALDGVAKLDEDRILRRFINLVNATCRTTFYQYDADGRPKPYLAFKLNSGMIEDLPKPRPWREIFVYSPRVEAVHLRGGKVARGGIRWSDRREDFRTEVLGLMKAQMVKNAVIVPVGSKGGFVVKRPPREGGREALLAEGIECYKTMMRGLLDLTDNLVGGAVVPPADVVRLDDDDPYLVVAADKGTATFSDIANGIAEDYGFWLSDAFASGGSAGYDHKTMGITARGAWECVKRHFRELGRDIQTEDFTVVGIGDMSGDVFGNGMLLSEHIRLTGAFNHLHVFVDPDPDPAVSFAERRRLFDLGRGSWDQYDRALISAGGGVFPRTAKSITVTPQMRDRFGLTRGHITPNELITAMLKAETDLLWFGGIGTFIKSRDESQAEVGDKANDAVRIDGQALRCKVVGEGANLALTQLGRIEAARHGVRLNTDFIDNSGGVDTSDHEVNLKILLNRVVGEGDMTVKQRNTLLDAMTGEVADLVLRDNYLQSQALTMAVAEGPERLDQQIRFMKALEKAGQLDRAIENLPDDEDLTERLGRKEGLTRPEQAVLLAYGKITLYGDLLATALPEDPCLARDLALYFPEAVRQDYSPAIERHPLRREIVATSITNSMVNRVGATFMSEMGDKTGMGPTDIARAYIVVRDAFVLRDLWQDIEALDNRVDATQQIHMMLAIRRQIERGSGWVLRHCGEDINIGALIEHYRPGIQLLMDELDQLIHEEARAVLDARAAVLMQHGVPEPLARRIAALNVMAAGFDLIRVADHCRLGLRQVAPVYFQLGRRLGLAWLRDSAMRMPSASHWQKQAVAAIVDDLYALQSDLTVRVLEAAQACGGGEEPLDPHAVIEAWFERRRQPIERIDQLIAELRALDTVDLSMVAVANRRLRGLIAG